MQNLNLFFLCLVVSAGFLAGFSVIEHPQPWMSGSPSLSWSGEYVWKETSPDKSVQSATWILGKVSNNQQVVVALEGKSGYTKLHRTMDFGVTWNIMQPAGSNTHNWVDFDMSIDGRYQITAYQTGYVYSSSDSGNTWIKAGIPQDKARDWSAVGLSANGTIQLAAKQDSVFISEDAGSNWSLLPLTGIPSNDWKQMKVSADGSTTLIADFLDYVFILTDTGYYWNALDPKGDMSTINWTDFALSGSGDSILILTYKDIYWSTDAGDNFSVITTGIDTTGLLWESAWLSPDGQHIMLTTYGGRIYLSVDGGQTWEEEQPAGNQSGNWGYVSGAADGTALIALETTGKVYLSDFNFVAGKSDTSGVFVAQIDNVHGTNATIRGVLWYLFSGTEKGLGDPGVESKDTMGVFGEGVFSITIPTLAPNAHYQVRAFATNEIGTGYADAREFWTNASTPGSIQISNVTSSSFDLILNGGSNPDSTVYSIQDSISGKFVQVDNKLDTPEIWRTLAEWGAFTVVNLSGKTTYQMRMRARNGAGAVTPFGPGTRTRTTGKATLSWVPGSPEFVELRPNDSTSSYWNIAEISRDNNCWILSPFLKPLLKSTDQGATWTTAQPDLSLQPTGQTNWINLAMSQTGNKMIISGSGSHVYYTSNGGQTWAKGTMPASNFYIFRDLAMSSSGDRCLAPAKEGLFKSTNGGQTWSQISPNSTTNKGWLQASISDNGLVWVAQDEDQKKVYKSADAGGSWEEITLPYTGEWNEIRLSSDGSGMLFAGYGLYLSTDGGSSFEKLSLSDETDDTWIDVWTSADFQKIVGVTYYGNVFKSENGGTTFSQIPNGKDATGWNVITGSEDGSKYLLGAIFNVGLFETKATIFDSIGTDLVRLGVQIDSLNGDSVKKIGVAYYPFDSTFLQIGDSSVVVGYDSAGVFGKGAYPITVTGLTPNIHYSVRGFTINFSDTSYTEKGDFWTFAAVPDTPNVLNPSATTLDLVINTNGNSDSTYYAIQDSATGKYLNIANRLLGFSPLWKKAEDWDTVTIQGLTSGQTYPLCVKAKNGEGNETAFSRATYAVTCSNPTSGGMISGADTICYNSKPNTLSSASLPSGQAGTLEYKWQKSILDPMAPGFQETAFSDIPNSDSIAISPDTLTKNTWFRRLARVSCKSDWVGAASSNVVLIAIETEQPTMKCRDVTISLDTAGTASIPIDSINNGSSDNCTLDTLMLDTTLFSCADGPFQMVILTGTDNAGNTDTCMARVQIEDKLPPNTACKDITLDLDDAGQAIVHAAQLDNGSSDNCSVDSLFLRDTLIECSAGPDATIFLLAMDPSGNLDSCEATVSLVDKSVPIEVCNSLNNLVLVWFGSEVFAASLATESDDNCGAENLEFAFDAAFTEKSRRFLCREKLKGSFDLEVFMRDKAGNQSSCTLKQVYAPNSENCECDWSGFKLKGSISPNDYKAKEYIIASGKVKNGDTVSAKAEHYITLKPGFHATAGSRFGAIIDSCTVKEDTFSIHNLTVQRTNRMSEEGGEGAEELNLNQRMLSESISIRSIGPNPFSGFTTLTFELDRPSEITIQMHDLSGRESRQLITAHPFQAGIHQLTIDGSRLLDGVYLLRIENGHASLTEKLVKLPD